MKATFKLTGLHEPVVVLQPENETEAILMASWLRYDSNAFRVYVERYQNGQIERVEIRAEQSA